MQTPHFVTVGRKKTQILFLIFFRKLHSVKFDVSTKKRKVFFTITLAYNKMLIARQFCQIKWKTNMYMIYWRYHLLEWDLIILSTGRL